MLVEKIKKSKIKNQSCCVRFADDPDNNREAIQKFCILLFAF